MAEPSCSRRPTECMAWSRRLPGVWLIAGRPRRSATRSRIWSPAGLRHRLRAPRWQRCGPAGRRPDPQAAAGARPSGRRALGVAADGLALREQRGARRALSAGARVGGVGHRAASPPARGRARRITMDLDPTRTRAEVFGPRESSPAASWAPVEDGGVVAQQPAPLRRTGSPCHDRIGLLDGDCRRVARAYPDRGAASLPRLSWSASRCRISQKTLA